MVDIGDPEEAFDALNAEIDHLEPDELLEVGHAAIALVLARTKVGKDVDGVPFKAYKPDYANERRRAGLQASPPDLVRTGHMLGAMLPEVTGANEVTVSFTADVEARKAAANNYGTRRGTPAREFLDVRLEQEQAFIAEVASEAMANRVEKKIA